MRDSQRQRLYDAEAQVGAQLDFATAGARLVAVAGSSLSLPRERRFGSLEDAAAYVESVTSSSGFTSRWPAAARTPLAVRRRAGDRAAHYQAPGTIALHVPTTGPGWSLRELVVLHEITHHAVHHDVGVDAAHGPAYAATMLALVGDVMGPEVALLLMTAFADHGVGFATAPTRRTG